MSRQEINIGNYFNVDKTPLQTWVKEKTSHETLVKSFRPMGLSGTRLSETAIHLVDGEILILGRKDIINNNGMLGDCFEMLTVGDMHESELISLGLLQPAEESVTSSARV